MFEYASDESYSNDGTSGEKLTEVRKMVIFCDASRWKVADAGADWIFPQVMAKIDEIMRLIPQERIQQRNAEQRVVQEMVKVDQIILGAYGVDVSVATRSQVPTIRTVQKTVEVLVQLQSLIEWWMCQLLMVCVSRYPDSAI